MVQNFTLRFFRVAEQTVRNFLTRFNEHLQAFQYKCNSNFSKHLLENQSADITDNTMAILYTPQEKVHISTQHKNITSMM
jgi:hypothetical protein